MTTVLVYIIPLAGLCLAGIILLRFRRRGSVNSVARELLERAIDQRSVMVVEFADPALSHGRSFGPCAEVGRRGVLIDVSLSKERTGWIGETVLVSFKIDSKNSSSYYQFTSRLRSLPRSIGGFGMLLEVPTEIVSGQHRHFVRISPRLDAVYGIGLWPLPHTQPRPDNPAVLGVAPLSYRKDHPESLSLDNLSAGGMGLRLQLPPKDPPQEGEPQEGEPQEDPPQAKQPSLDPQPGDRLLCLLILRSQTEGRPLPFWLDCSVVNRREEQDEQYCMVGLHFDAWAVPHRGKKTVDWFTVGGGGAAGPLVSWVLQQQLAQFGGNQEDR